MSYILRRYPHFLCRSVTQKINYVTRSVDIQNGFEMLSERLFGHLRISCQINFFLKTALLPKNWHRATDLNMANEGALGYNNNLFFFAEIGNIALVIYSTRIIAGACTFPHPASNKSHLSFDPADLATCLAEVALD